MMSASFVALVESTGAFIAVSRYASTTPCPPSVMSRGIGWQGVGILLGGLFGTAYGSSVSVENAGLLGLTRVGSRRVVQISAGFMIFSLYSCFKLARQQWKSIHWVAFQSIILWMEESIWIIPMRRRRC